MREQAPTHSSMSLGAPIPGVCTEREARHHRGHGPHDHEHEGAPRRGGGTPVEVHERLLAANDQHAAGIRERFTAHGVFAANLMSSPGAGKTSLLEATLARLEGDLRLGIVEGDIETSVDADRLAPYGVPVVQINTGPFGGDCHLAAPLVAGAVQKLDLRSLDIVIVENVGNLVCPAEFDIGEDRKVVLLSVTEGEDKPLKYPLMFHEAALVVLTKIDLLPHLDVDVRLIEANIRRINPLAPVFLTSAKSGAGIDAWVDWLREGYRAKSAAASE